jgi:hypothetical protein
MGPTSREFPPIFLVRGARAALEGRDSDKDEALMAGRVGMRPAEKRLLSSESKSPLVSPLFAEMGVSWLESREWTSGVR